MKQLTLTKALNLCVLSCPCVLAMFLFFLSLKKIMLGECCQKHLIITAKKAEFSKDEE